MLKEELTLIEYIKNRIFPENLNSIMELILQEILEGKSYLEIANKHGYSHNYVRRISAELLSILSEKFELKITKTNIKKNLSAKYQETRKTQNKINIKDWHISPKLGNFYGRNQELKQLHDLIFLNQTRLIYLLGIGGIGKTALTVKFMQEYQSEFEVIIWRSLRNAPSLSTLINDIISVISNYENLAGKIEDLITFLQSYRCLIILDNVETILAAGKVGYYRSGFEDYGNLIRFFGESNHQSTIILTGREKPPEVHFLEGENSQVKTLILKGSQDTALAILAENKVTGNEKERLNLVKQYDYSPLAIKLVSHVIKDLFTNNISNFLAQKTTIVKSLNIILDEQFKRLTETEKSIMYWLAINRDFTSIEQLAEDIIPPIQKSELLGALQSLTWRSLLETEGQKYSQQAVIMEYILEKFINNIYQEIITLKLDLFAKYPLTKITVKEYIRETQIKLIVEPLATLLKQIFPIKIKLEKQFQQILTILKELPLSNYGAGNIIDLCNSLNLPFQNYDFSELPIWETDLSTSFFQGINFSYCDFRKVKFLHTLGGIVKVAYHPNGEIIANSDINKIIYLWRVKDGQNILQLKGHESWVYDLKFSQDGTILVSSSDDQTVKIWDLKTGNCLVNYDLKEYKVNSISLSKNQEIIAIAANKGYLELWYWQINKHAILTGHQETVNSVEFSNDNEYLFSASLDSTIKKWNLANFSCEKTFQCQQNGVNFLALSPDNKLLLTISIEGKLTMYLLETGAYLYTLGDDNLIIYRAEFSQSGETFATAANNIITFYHSLTGKIIKSLPPQKGKITTLSYSPNDKTLITGSPQECTIFWDIETGDRLHTLYGYSNHIWALSSNKKNLLASGSSDGIIRIWLLEKNAPINEIKADQGAIFTLKWHPNSKIFASGGSDSFVRIWQSETGKCDQKISTNIDLIQTISWHPQGQILAIAGRSCEIKFWDFLNHKYCHELKLKTTEIMHLSWSNNGQLLAIYTRKGEIFIYDYFQDNLELIYQNKQANINDVRNQVTWSNNNNYLAFTGDNNTVKIYQIKTKKFLPSLEGHLARVVGINFIKNEQLIITVSLDTTVRIWEFSSGKCLHILTEHQEPVTCLTVINEDYFATGSADSTIRIWDINTAKSLQILTSNLPYKNTNLRQTTGLNTWELKNLKNLGAINI